MSCREHLAPVCPFPSILHASPGEIFPCTDWTALSLLRALRCLPSTWAFTLSSLVWYSKLFTIWLFHSLLTRFWSNPLTQVRALQFLPKTTSCFTPQPLPGVPLPPFHTCLSKSNSIVIYSEEISDFYVPLPCPVFHPKVLYHDKEPPHVKHHIAIGFWWPLWIPAAAGRQLSKHWPSAGAHHIVLLFCLTVFSEVAGDGPAQAQGSLEMQASSPPPPPEEPSITSWEWKSWANAQPPSLQGDSFGGVHHCSSEDAQLDGVHPPTLVTCSLVGTCFLTFSPPISFFAPSLCCFLGSFPK